MTALHTLTQLKNFCNTGTGDDHIGTNNGTTYQWSISKSTSTDTTNGVIRKLAGIDSHGRQIWVVAGSLKIDSTGAILRFTGLPRKVQKTLEYVHETNTNNPIDFPVLEVV